MCKGKVGMHKKLLKEVFGSLEKDQIITVTYRDINNTKQELKFKEKKSGPGRGGGALKCTFIDTACNKEVIIESKECFKIKTVVVNGKVFETLHRDSPKNIKPKFNIEKANTLKQLMLNFFDLPKEQLITIKSTLPELNKTWKLIDISKSVGRYGQIVMILENPNNYEQRKIIRSYQNCEQIIDINLVYG